MKNYKGYLIDLDGTMYLGTDEIDGAAQRLRYEIRSTNAGFGATSVSRAQAGIRHRQSRIRCTPRRYSKGRN